MDKKEYRSPKPTVDVIIELPDGIVLIERKNEPYGWAIPGGFVDEGEPVEEAALREVREETGIDVILNDLLYVYSDPRRDPRLHTLTTVFVGRPWREGARPKADDDAKNAVVVSPEKLPTPMAFDHAGILADYLVWKRTGQRPDALARKDPASCPLKKPSQHDPSPRSRPGSSCTPTSSPASGRKSPATSLAAYVKGARLTTTSGPKDPEVLAIVARHTTVPVETVKASFRFYIASGERPRLESGRRRLPARRVTCP